VSTIRCFFTSSTASASGTWVLVSTHQKLQAWNDMTTRGACVSAARNSVWPGKSYPARWMDFLLMGAVISASRRPDMQPNTASSMYSMDARP